MLSPKKIFTIPVYNLELGILNVTCTLFLALWSHGDIYIMDTMTFYGHNDTVPLHHFPSLFPVTSSSFLSCRWPGQNGELRENCENDIMPLFLNYQSSVKKNYRAVSNYQFLKTPTFTFTLYFHFDTSPTRF